MFPNLLGSLFENPVIQRAQKQGKVQIEAVDIKDYADGSFRHIDDSPYGGTPGMIMRIEPLVRSLESVKTTNSHVVLLSPKGQTYNQATARKYSKLDHLILVCGHYEGVDARFESYVDEQISIGDFILTGGEGAAALIADSVVRLLDGTLKDGVTEDESHEKGLLECPHFAHPIEYKGAKVREILLTGNTKEIAKWRHAMAIIETKKYRPDMAERYMKAQIPKAEEALRCTFSQKLSLKNGVLRYADSLLPDMYDHNMFIYASDLGKTELKELIQYQKENNFDFIKIEGFSPLDEKTVNGLNLESWEELTMSLCDKSVCESWKTNPEVEIRELSKHKIGKDIINLEMENYASVYGEDFTLRKIHRHLTIAERNKKMDFICAYINNVIAGYLFVWTDSDCVGIDDLIVSSQFRNKRVATSLLKYAVSLAPFAYLHAASDDTPKDMYYKLGFRVSGTKYCYFSKI